MKCNSGPGRPLSQARDVRSALVNRLCCAAFAVFVGVLSTKFERSQSFIEYRLGWWALTTRSKKKDGKEKST